MRSYTAAIATVLILAAGRADAGYQFVFGDTSGNLKTNFDLNYKTSTFVDVNVYLQATGTTDISNLRTNGLKTFGVQLGYTGVNAKVVSAASPNIKTNAAFGDVEAVFVTPTSATANDLINGGTANVTAGAADDKILLATFRFTGFADGLMTIGTADPDVNFGVDDTIDGNNVVLDALIANTNATITVTNVPEPGTLALGGVLAAGLAAARLRRARRAAA
jgi:hypothetical protein